MKYIEQIKEQGYSTIIVEDSFSDAVFTQIAFRDGANISHVACFKQEQLITII